MTEDNSSLRASVPDAPTMPLWLDHRRQYMRFEFENGPLELAMPRLLLSEEIDEFEAIVSIHVGQLRRRAGAIEATPNTKRSGE